jgi:hypothetical protein
VNTDNEEESVNHKQGVINKCPNCGGALKAFTTSCELCGHELAGVAASRSITYLADKFEEIESEVSRIGLQGSAREKEIVLRKAQVIRDFPIPNSREDLQSLIYFIHPKIQDNIKPDPNMEDWRVKFKEVLTLAKNAYRGDAKTRAEFEEIERSLITTVSGTLQTRAKRYPMVAIGVAAVIALAVIGLASSQYSNWQQGKCEEKYTHGAVVENKRLNDIVAAVQAKHGEMKFAEAKSTLNQLSWEYQEACKTEDTQKEKAQWEEKRKELFAQIQNSEAGINAQKYEAERLEQAKIQEEANREMARKRNQTDREMEDSLSNRAKAAAARR